MVSNWFLDAELARLKLDDYLGAYSVDDIPVEKIKNNEASSIICNLSKAGEKGTHFVAIRFTKESIFYFDSFGLINLLHMRKLLSTLLSTLLRETGRRRLIFELHQSIQDIQSDFCGFFCLYYTLITDSAYKGRRYTLKNFYSQQDRLKENDLIVIQNINSVITDTYHRI